MSGWFATPIAHDGGWFDRDDYVDRLGRTQPVAAPAARIEAYSAVRDTATGCWEWQRSRNAAGYGQLCVRGRKYLAHRLAYAIWCGDVPAGALVCHRCDNPPCCNPEHLFLGDYQENAADMVRKGRQVARKGLENGRAKLDEQQVAHIRTAVSMGESRKSVGRRLGLHPSYVGRIAAGHRRTA